MSKIARMMMTGLLGDGLRYLPFNPTLVQTDGTLTNNNPDFTFTAQASPVYGDLGFYGAAVTRQNGLALVGKINLSTWEEMGVGFHGAAAVANPNTWKHALVASLTDGRLDSVVASSLITGLSLSTEYPFAIVLGNTRTKTLIKIGADWRLLNLEGDTTATLYPAFASLDAVGAMTFRLANLPFPWNADYGINTVNLPGARTAGESFNHDADCLIDFTVDALPSAGSILIDFRRQDNTNKWQIKIEPTGDITLVEWQTTSAVRHGPVAAAVTNGSRVSIRAVGSSIRSVVANGTKNSFTSTDFAAMTEGRINSLGTGGAISNLEVWPIYQGGAAFTALNQYTANFSGAGAPGTHPTDSRTWAYGWEDNLITGAGRWNALQAVDVDRMTLVTDIKRAGTYAARCEVRAGDDPGNHNSERVEVAHLRDVQDQSIYENEASGTQYYALSVKLAADWNPPTWTIPIQLHGQDDLIAPPPFALWLDGGRYTIFINGGDLDNPGHYNETLELTNNSLNPGEWVDWVFKIQYARDNSGAVTVWRRDEGETQFTQVLDQSGIPTLQYRGNLAGGNYWKAGNYRSVSAYTTVLWIDCLARAQSFAAVVAAAWG